MLRQHLEKEKCNRLCNGTIYGEELFLKHIQGQLDEFVWGFLKINMKVYPHKHPQKEVYLFLKGKGTMQIEDEKFIVTKGDAVYIEPNALHTVWNKDSEDLEFIIIRTRKPSIHNTIISILFGK
jgi:mannose-6-phosphate isomerase-like protein (cupin superfamily)